jgi:hypothetical protein
VADERLRELERRAALGDETARAQLHRERVRQGRLPPGSHLLSPRERVDAWVRAHRIEGLEVGEAEVDLERHQGIADCVDGAVELRFWVAYERPDDVRLLVANLVEDLEWADPAWLRIQPMANRGAFEVTARVYLFAPQRMFRSDACREALEGPTPTHLHLWDLAVATYERLSAALPDDDRRRVAEGLQAMLFSGLSSYGRPATEAFEANLDDDLANALRDLRLASDLGRSHRALVLRLDEWVNQDRSAPDGAVQGVELTLPVWTTYLSIYGQRTLPEMRAGGGAAEPARCLEAADLVHTPSRWHPARVCAVAVAPGGRVFASADVTGWVQLSGCAGEDAIPLAGRRVHGAGAVALDWLDAQHLLTCGADGRLVRCRLRAPDGVRQEVEAEEVWAHERALTAVAALRGSHEPIAVADDAGGIWRLAAGGEPSAVGAEPRAVPRRSAVPVARMLADEGWLVAQDAAGLLEVWSLAEPGPPVWADSEPSSFFTFHGPGLAVGRGDGRAVTLELPSGRELGPYNLPGDGEPFYVRAVLDGAVVAYPGGPIRVTCGRGLIAVIPTTLQAVHAEPEAGVVAYADVRRRLNLTRFDP